MTKLDPRKFERYLELAKATPKPDNWDVEPAVVDVFAKEAGPRYLRHAVEDQELRGEINSFCSTWFTAFQMGREFESRRREESELKKLMRKGVE